MANLPTTKRITQEELQGDPQQQIQTMMRPLNLFFEDVYSALNRDLTFQENIDAQITTVRFKVPADYPRVDRWDDVSFLLSMKRVPSGAYVINVNDITSPNDVLYNPVWAHITFTSTTATIQYMTGLRPCHTYNITILVV